MNPFIQNLHRVSPRYVRRPVPWQSNAVHCLVLAGLILALTQIFHGGPIARWSVGIIYAAYDSLLIIFTLSQILRRSGKKGISATGLTTATIVVACFNEAGLLDKTISALQSQIAPSDRIIIADDGSTDNIARLLQEKFGIDRSAIDGLSSQGNLSWLRLEHRGKSNALNQALEHIETALFITVDADTILHNAALQAMKDAFSLDSCLVAATGVLQPLCRKGRQQVFFEFFQKYEYMRNFLSRSAWAKIDGLLLLSGAFAGYRTQAVKEAGGFDDACIVEDYELTHRLMSHSFENNLKWRTAIVEQAGATTMAPGRLSAFLNQRRRWFSGFLQTQSAYRHMTANPSYGQVGVVMLPVKAIDTLQPVFGLTGFVLLIYYLLTVNWHLLAPIFAVIACKLILDLTAVTAFLFIFDRWEGSRIPQNLWAAWLATFAEPFLFQPLRHLGAMLGWWDFLSKDTKWRTGA